MVQRMKEVPDNMIGFRASGLISRDEFTAHVVPEIQETIARKGTLNYLLVLDPAIENNCLDSWWEESLLSLKHLREWHRVGVVSNSEEIKEFTYLFGLVNPGEFKGFVYDDLQSAIVWVAEKDVHTLSA